MPRRSQARIWAELLRQNQNLVALAFLQAIRDASGRIDMRALATAIEAGDIVRATELLRINPAALFLLSEAVRAAYVAGGASAGSIGPRGAVFGFDGRHVRAEAWLAANSGRMIQNITDDVLPMVQARLSDGLARGRTAPQIAREIRASVGLTTQQTDAAIRARQQLADLDAAYFNRQLRDRRFDGMVRKAIDAGKPLAQADIARITTRYEERMLAYRGRDIAFQETAGAIAKGQEEGFRQAIETGQAQAVTKRWIHNTANQKEREDHVFMASMPAIPHDVDFVLPDGTRMSVPHDPAGGPKHNASCRCISFWRVIV